MTTRKPISTRTRFEVFKRDDFTCAYCGSKPPSVILHVDHITPVSKGGSSRQDNLITSCESCNLGKSNVLLSSVPESLSDKAEKIKEAEKQIRAYRKIMKAKQDRIDSEKWDVMRTIYGREIEQAPKKDIASIAKFIDLLGYEDCLYAASLTDSRGLYDNKRFRYFCGICWNMIRGEEDGART